MSSNRVCRSQGSGTIKLESVTLAKQSMQIYVRLSEAGDQHKHAFLTRVMFHL